MSQSELTQILNAMNQMKSEINNQISQLHERIGEVKSELKAEIQEVRNEFKSQIDAVNARIDSYHGKQTKKSNGARITNLENRMDVAEERINEHDVKFNKLKIE